MGQFGLLNPIADFGATYENIFTLCEMLNQGTVAVAFDAKLTDSCQA